MHQLKRGLEMCCCPGSFIHSGYFYSASSNPLLLRSAPETARILCRSFTPKRHRQLLVKDLPKVFTRRLERDSNPRPFGRKATNLPMSHYSPQKVRGTCTPDLWAMGDTTMKKKSYERLRNGICQEVLLTGSITA